MRTNSFTKKGNNLILSLLLAVIFTFIISSCNNQEEYSGPGCFQLTKSKIKNNWVDNGYTKQSSKDIIIFIEFFTINDPVKKEFYVHAQLVKCDTVTKISTVINGSQIKNISKVKNCKIDLPPLLYGKNLLKLAELDILEPGGDKIKDFDHLIITPIQSSREKNSLAFNWEKIEKNKIAAKGETWPCPEYCCPGPKCPTNDSNSTQ